MGHSFDHVLTAQHVAHVWNHNSQEAEAEAIQMDNSQNQSIINPLMKIVSY